MTKDESPGGDGEVLKNIDSYENKHIYSNSSHAILIILDGMQR